ncbi:MAG: DUF6291 domain-containing protein [Eubacteriales bacterium]|nr:DUF6291 domain-containing protein [Eubacteriales bacterium]
MAREYFNAYHSYLEAIEPLNDAERGRLFTACLYYSMTGEVLELRGNERFAFAGMKSQIDRDSKQYENRCETNRKNGSLGGQTKPSERYQTLPNATERYPAPPKEKEKAKEKEKTKEKENGNSADKPRRFTKPTVVEIRDYCRERRNGIDPQRFFDFYEAKGWRVGNQPMKDWQAAVRTWEGREPAKSPDCGTSNPFKRMLMEEARRNGQSGMHEDFSDTADSLSGFL